MCLFELRKILRELGADVALMSARKVEQTWCVVVLISLHARLLETLVHTREDLPKRDSFVEIRLTSPQCVPTLHESMASLTQSLHYLIEINYQLHP